MKNNEIARKLINSLSGQENILTIPKVYLEITGDYQSAILLNQIVFWSDRTKRKDGFFYKSYKDWEQEVLLTQYQVKRATSHLNQLGLVDTKLKRANNAPTIHYKINMEALTEAIINKLDNQETSQSDYEETQQTDYKETSQSDYEETQQTLTDEYTDDYTEEYTDKSPQSQKRYDDDSPYIKLAQRLLGHIQQRDPKYKDRNMQTWADDMRKLVELDKRSIEEVERVLDWSQQDTFWQTNILSPNKLRKHFSKLYQQCKAKQPIEYTFAGNSKKEKEPTPEEIAEFEKWKEEFRWE